MYPDKLEKQNIGGTCTAMEQSTNIRLVVLPLDGDVSCINDDMEAGLAGRA